MSKRDEDQSEDSPYGTPRSSSNDGTTSSNNIPPTSTSLALPAIASPSDLLSPHLVETPSNGLDHGATIGIIVAIVVAMLFIIGMIDVLLLSSRVQKALSKKTARLLKHGEQPPSRFPPQHWDSKLEKLLPSVPHPAYFSEEIRPSEKRNSFNSGYSSRYSRSMSFDSGIAIHDYTSMDGKGMGGYNSKYDSGYGETSVEYAKSFVSTIARRSLDDDKRSQISKYSHAARSFKGGVRPGMGVGNWDDGESEWYSVYEESIYEDDGSENPLPLPELLPPSKRRMWDEESGIGTNMVGARNINARKADIQRSKTDVNTYRGRIKAGMGVQKRHTMIFVREVEKVRRAMAVQEQIEERDRVNFEIWRRFWGVKEGVKGRA